MTEGVFAPIKSVVHGVPSVVEEVFVIIKRLEEGQEEESGESGDSGELGI